MPPEPLDDVRVLVGDVVVEHDMDLLGCGYVAFDGVQEADELLMPMASYAAADNAAFEHVQRSDVVRSALTRRRFGTRTRRR